MFDRFAVHKVRDDASQLVVILQYPGLDTGPAVLVAPLLPSEDFKPLPPITVDVGIDGGGYLLAVHQTSAFPVSYLGEQVGSLEAFEYDIARALSRLFFGN